MTKRDLKSLVIPLFTIVLGKNFLITKICFYCGSHRTIKKGKDNGYQRWFCKDCKRYFMGRLRLKKEDVNSTYSLGNLTVSDLAREFGVSTRTIHRYLSSEYKENLPKLISSNVVVLMDATYWGRRFGVVIMKDHISGRVLWYKFIDKKETIADYREGISYLELHGYNVLGIVSDGLKGFVKSSTSTDSNIASSTSL